MSNFAEQYELFYYGSLSGRGEIIRVVFAAAGVTWKENSNMDSIMFHRNYRNQGNIGFAPPYIQDQSNGLVLAQTPAILQYIGEKHGLAPLDSEGRAVALAQALTIADVWAEVEQFTLKYRDDKEGCIAKAKTFLGDRAKQFFGYFNEILRRNNGMLCRDDILTYVDVFLFLTLEAFAFSFPKAYRTLTDMFPLVYRFHNHLPLKSPGLAEHMRGPKRVHFNDGWDMFWKCPDFNFDVNP